jgi:hypothetical protein
MLNGFLKPDRGAMVIVGSPSAHFVFLQNAYTARWFEGPLLSLAFSIVLMFSRLGSSVNFIVTPMLADKVGGAIT